LNRARNNSKFSFSSSVAGFTACFPFSGAFLEIRLRFRVLKQEFWYEIAEEDAAVRHPVPLNGVLDLLLRPQGK
jgi:hypothetical protein